MDKYKIYKNGLGQYSIKKKFSFHWKWLDITKTWCNWYGKKYPYVFFNKSELDNFIKEDNWEIIN